MISLLDRYIGKTVLLSIALVVLLLAGLQLFILFVGQLDDLGKGDYGMVQASFFVLEQLPYQVYLFFPIASLLGCLIGLGLLANHSELIVMRASGLSIAQISLAVFKASLMLIILVTALGETLVPYLSHEANDAKVLALSKGQTLRTGQGLWFRFRNDFISIGSIAPDQVLYDVYQFRFDAQHHLKMTRSLAKVKYENHFWMAYGVKQTEFQEQGTKASEYPSMPWDVWIKPQIFNIHSRSPDEMTLHELRRYVRSQKRSYQNMHQYQFVFFQRLIQPLTTLVMMGLAIPFIFGPLRSSSMGSKLLVGATIGFGFHILNRFFGPMSAVFQWPPELAAIGPTFLFALLGFYLMKRVR